MQEQEIAFLKKIGSEAAEQILKQDSSLEDFAKKHHYTIDELEAMCDGEFSSLERFFDFVYATNVVLEFKDCNGNHHYFPEPKASDCTSLDQES